MYIILVSVITFLGGVIGFLVRKRFSEATIGSAKEVAKRLIEEAEKKAEILKKEALLQAKDKFYQEKAEFEKETTEKRQEIQNLERRIIQRESHLDKKIELLDTKEAEITRREKTLNSSSLQRLKFLLGHSEISPLQSSIFLYLLYGEKRKKS